MLGSHNDTEDVEQKSSDSKSTVLPVAQLELRLQVVPLQCTYYALGSCARC